MMTANSELILTLFVFSTSSFLVTSLKCLECTSISGSMSKELSIIFLIKETKDNP